MKVVITDTAEPLNRDLDYEKRLLRRMLGDQAEIVVYPYAGDRQELINTIQDADAILTSYLTFDAELLQACHRLKVISIEATGYNNIDMVAAKSQGVAVCVIAEYCTEEVSDFVVLSAISMNKQLKYYMTQVDQHDSYDFQPNKPVRRLSDSVFGIMGLGKIGSEAARKAQAFGMKVISYSTPHAQKRAAEMNIPLVSKAELFAQSDFIALTMRLTKENTHILNEDTFNQMKKSPIIVNIARGVMIDEDALLTALDSGKVRGAALDVLTNESAQGLKESKLVGRDDVMITPHVAFYSDQSLEDCQRIAVENLAYSLLGNEEKLFRQVN
ncbi:NAD(P)-dependent oxidoreductase [Lentilactobacillus kisonensis]|uniref:4-phosphoerythronate dehydrogenase n=1 Tax=Lentilactobacillus kisonensis DSM 19906 = JCM 15041 TaxID=1423766 RepID=A0A0R1NZ37_9LACO|nr:NAD(P)-dependent oxidoreductase [Lentilactobacillus kisonensis]KRL22946.1 4-phosphoerythronate dehydrogenase [Lentilactobacillus kisonensis DSM 19906 = JCM 15041]